jgi:hypothetical protein
MATSLKISVEGDFKTKVVYKQGDRKGEITVSGCGCEGPNEVHVPLFPDAGPLTVTVHPEEVDAPQANALFPILPAASIEPLQKVAKFYVWDHMINQVRWMCSWDTTQADVDNFVAAVKSELAN